MTIKNFCKKHNACKDGLDWALSTGCQTMSELWLRDDIKPEWRIWIATRPGVMSDRDLRLFSCWCVRQVWHLLADERSRNAVEVAERYAMGEAAIDELDAASAAAWDAASAAARDAASAAAWDAAWAAARDAAWAATLAAAWAAASAAASGAARGVAWDAAWDAALDAQSKRLRGYEVIFSCEEAI